MSVYCGESLCGVGMMGVERSHGDLERREASESREGKPIL